MFRIATTETYDTTFCIDEWINCSNEYDKSKTWLKLVIQKSVLCCVSIRLFRRGKVALCGYNMVLPYLINKYPYTKICLCVPFGCDVGHRQAIRNLANKWGLACWDNYLGWTPLYFGKDPSVEVNSTIVSHNQQIFQANGAHPNFKGAQTNSRYVRALFARHII